MTGFVDRMLARARTPRSRVRPLLPSRYESGWERGAGDAAWPAEEVSERVGGYPAAPMPGAGPSEATVVSSSRTPVDPLRVEGTVIEVDETRQAPSIERPGPVARPADQIPPNGPLEPRPNPAPPRRPAQADPGRQGTPEPPPAVPARVPSVAAVTRRDARSREERVAREAPAIVEGRIDPPSSGRDVARRDGSSMPSIVRDRAAPEPGEPPARRGTTEVSISIGHIEVRTAPAAPPRRTPPARPRVTLEDYLRRREEAGR